MGHETYTVFFAKFSASTEKNLQALSNRFQIIRSQLKNFNLKNKTLWEFRRYFTPILVSERNLRL